VSVNITDEMRAAVHDEDCSNLGHDMSLDTAFLIMDTVPRAQFGSRDPDKMPHLSCLRCGRVWLVIEDAGASYADAEAKLTGRLKDPKKLRIKA